MGYKKSSKTNSISRTNASSPISSRSGDKRRIVAIACSTGGPQALNVMVPMLPKHLGVPVVLVQHMPKGFTKALAERLDSKSVISVKEAEDSEELKDDCIYIAPGGKHLKVVQNSARKFAIEIDDSEPRGALKPCADIMYESICNLPVDEVICVVLTGMGMDGTKGIQQLKHRRNIFVISEAAETCVVYGMPKGVETNGLSDVVVPIDKIADAIAKKLGV